jgi:type IX secretion system PorP/SprF family membrane protein
MRRIYFLMCIQMIACVGFAQQKPHYTQYILNQYIINPALTGIENYVDAKVSHRLQWVGLQDAPVTTYFTIHGPIGKSDYKTTATSFNTPGENPRGQSYWDEYVASKPHHGWGVQVVNDKTGPLNNLTAMGTYAYHLGLSPKTNLSVGFGMGIANTSLDASKLQFYGGSVDPSVAGSGVLNNVRFDMNAGLYLYSADYFVGLSALQIVPSKLDYSNNIVKQLEGKAVPHFFATAGYRFLLNEDFNITPSVLAKYVQPVPTQIEANVKLQYRDLLWTGLSYRHNDGVAAMAGINVSNIFMVGYAYDYTTSRLNNYTKGTHEIVLGFMLGNKFGDTCPRNVW